MEVQYHPDPSINAGITTDVIQAEAVDLQAGYPPRRWTCPCGKSHSRGHFQAIGQHRCLGCGYVGTGGVMWDPKTEPPPEGAL